MGARGGGLKTLTDLVQEGCNRRNGHNGPQPGDSRITEAILTSVETPRLNPPGGSMVAAAMILTFKMKENAHFGPPDFKFSPAAHVTAT